jgi:NADH pyrophosphatase NudC (nudix superfamily)
MCWGFDCPDTWFDLIKELSVMGENFNKEFVKRGIDARIEAVQVKEKFGELRFYYILVTSGLSDEESKRIDGEFSHAVEIAEDKSTKICAYCGKPATTSTAGWITYVCPDCLKKRMAGEDIETE